MINLDLTSFLQEFCELNKLLIIHTAEHPSFSFYTVSFLYSLFLRIHAE
jgi:hypothetical protein